MLRRRRLNPLAPPPPIPRHRLRPNPPASAHFGNRRSVPCGSIHGNYRSAPSAPTADRGGRDATTSTSTNCSIPHPLPIRVPLPTPISLEFGDQARNRCDAAGSGYAVELSILFPSVQSSHRGWEAEFQVEQGEFEDYGLHLFLAFYELILISLCNFLVFKCILHKDLERSQYGARPLIQQIKDQITVLTSMQASDPSVVGVMRQEWWPCRI